MEATGLVLGVLALPSAVDGCLSLYRAYCDSTEYDNELQYFALCFQIQRARFASIAEVLQNYSTNLDGHRVGNATSPVTFIGSYLDNTSRQLKQSSERLSKYSKSQGKLKKLKWIVSDKGELEDRLKRLTHLNTEMVDILPATDRVSIIHAVWMKLLHQSSYPVSPQRALQFYNPQNIGQITSTQQGSTFIQPQRYQIRTDITPLAIANVESVSVSSNCGLPLQAIVEWRPTFSTSESQTETHARMENIVGILHSLYQLQEISIASQHIGLGPLRLGALKCLGWISPCRSDFDKLGIIYELPCSTSSSLTRPVTLHTFILSRQPSPDISLALGDRFDLARQIVSIVYNLHLLECRHKNISSKSLILPDDNLKFIYLINFSDARSSLPSDGGGNEDKASSQLPFDDEAALYRPYSLISMASTQRYLPHFDIYSLGVVLLELGLCRTASQIQQRHSRQIPIGMREFHQKVLPAETRKLSFRCGKIYESVVSRCLLQGQPSVTGVVDGHEVALAQDPISSPQPGAQHQQQQQKRQEVSTFLTEVRAVLAKCVA